MKFALIVLLCVGTALGRIEEWNWLNQVSPNRKIEDEAFRSGREYQFFYNGQLATGVVGSSKQHSATRIQSIVRIVFKNQDTCLMRMENIRKGKLNREVPNPRKMIPFDAFENVEIDQHLKTKLEATVQFKYTGGLVKDVVFDSQEEPWSANMKRGILNLLQVNLQQHKRLDVADDVRLTNTRGSVQDNEDLTFYRVMEETIEGECETLYNIQKQHEGRQWRSNGQILNVTKSINFEKCNKRPQVKYNFRFADPCPSCETKYNDDEKFLKSSTVAKYQIKGDKQNFLIETATIDSEYVFVPFSEGSNVIVTYVNQTLVLVKSGPAGSIQHPQNPIESDTDMIFTLDWDIAFEKFHMDGSSEAHRQLHGHVSPSLKIVDLGKKMLKKILSQMKEQIDEEVPRQLMNLVKILRMCKSEELNHICQTQEQSDLNPEDKKKAKAIIPQALGLCGTKECTKMLTKEIREGKISPLRGAFAVKGLLHNRVVSKEIIHELLELVESEKARESQPLKRHLWLTIGSLMNALCAENEDQLATEYKETSEKLCPRTLKQQYVEKLFQKLREANKWHEKVLMMKVIGNAGIDLSVFELDKIIHQHDASYPMYLRLEAILALRQLKDAMPKKVQRILMPVIMNRREYPTIRSGAAYTLLQTLPERPILDQLARSLVNEPSHQFASFLWTQMQTYANSTNPCEKQLSADLKLALRQAKKISTGLGYSKMAHWSFHSESTKLGLDADFDIFYSNVSAIPRRFGFDLHANFLGFWHKYLASAHIFTEGFDSTLRKFYTPGDYLQTIQDDWSGSSEEADSTNRRHPRSVRQNTPQNEYERELDQLFSGDLKIRNRDYRDEFENQAKFYLSAMYKSQSVVYVPLNKELIQQIVRENNWNMLDMYTKLRQGLPIEYASVAQLHDLHYKIPTTLGLPLSITVKAPIAWSVQGKLQADIQPTSSRKTVNIHAQLKPSAVLTIQCDMEAWSPVINSGVKVVSKAKFFAPIDARIEAEIGGGQPLNIKAIIKPPTQKRDLFVFESRPLTYTREWQRYLRNLEDTHDEQTIMGEEQNRLATFNKCYGRQSYGVEICARGQIHHTPEKSVKGTPYSPLSGPNKLVVSVQPESTSSPKDIHIKLTGKWQPFNGNEMQKPQFSNYRLPEDDDVSSQASQEFQRSGEQTSQERRQSRQPRKSSTEKQRFMQLYRDYQVKKGYKSQLLLETSSGSERRMTVELSHVLDVKKRYGKLDMKVDCHSPERWQACLDAEMMYPESPAQIKEVKDKKIVGHAQLQWGQTCNSQNFIRINTQAERSRQQMQWERDQSEYKQYQQRQCQNKAWCSPLTQEDLLEKIGQMLKYRVDIDYKNVPNGVKNVTNKLYRALKHYYYWQADVDQMDVQNPQNKIRAEFVVDAQTKQRVNVTIKTPKENLQIQDLPLSVPVGCLSQKQSIGEQLRDFVNDDDDQAECTITGKKGWQRRSQIDTFDGTKFGAPFTDCWVVLAKDCGSPQPKFVVMARKSTQRGNDELKDVKIITRHQRIEMQPDSDEYDSVKVKVNGQEYNPETEDDLTVNGRVVARIDKEDKAIVVELPETGVQVEFDGYAINIKLSQAYRGQQCGLCGHFDLESTDEFRNPDFTEERDVRRFIMNYLIKDGRCQAPSQLTEVCESEECDRESASTSSSSSSSQDEDDNDNDETTEKPDLQTKIIEIDDELCFSTRPIPQCDDDSYAMSTKPQPERVSYVCIDQDSKSAEDYERQVRHGRHEIPELRNRTPKFTRNENIPEKCKKYK
jgi:hypothetical protein